MFKQCLRVLVADATMLASYCVIRLCHSTWLVGTWAPLLLSLPRHRRRVSVALTT